MQSGDAMKLVTKTIVTLVFVSVIAGSGFAASGYGTFSEPAVTVEKHAAKNGPRRRAQRLTTIPYLKNSTKTIRVRRLSRRQRQDVYRRLIDIQIN
jgi:hypothetical protein